MDERDNDISSMLTTPFSQAVICVVLFVALLHGQRGLALMLLLLLILIVGTRFWGRACIDRLALDTTIDYYRLFPGDRCTLTVQVQNNSWLPAWMKIDLSADCALELAQNGISGPLPTREISLLWYQQAIDTWKLKATQRGVYQVGASHIRAGDFFGFFPRDQQLENYLEILVYPRLIPIHLKSLARREVWGVPGTIHPVKDPIYLLGTREYQQIQPARYIHWKASARLNCLQEKMFESTSQEKILLLFDVESYARHDGEEQFERTIEVVASLGINLLGKGHTVGLITNGILITGDQQILPLSTSRYQAQAMLELLAAIKMKASGGFTTTLANYANMLWNVSCVYFSYSCDQSAVDVDKKLQKRRLPRAFVNSKCVSENEKSHQNTITGTQYRLEELLF